MITEEELRQLSLEQLKMAYCCIWGQCECKLNQEDYIQHFLRTEEQILQAFRDPLLRSILKKEKAEKFRQDILHIDHIVKQYIKKSKEDENVEVLVH